MRRSALPKLSVLAAFLVAALVLATGGGAVAKRQQKPPASFFGIAPQTDLSATDTATMRSGGIGSIRIGVSWSLIESSPGRYDWYSLDSAVIAAAENEIQVMPYLYATPERFSPVPTNLPLDGAASAAWASFVKAAVARYGPGGSFWSEHAPGTSQPLPPVPVGLWQIWNEPNFFYFTTPASPKRYAKLVKATATAIKSVDPRAKVMLGGLFGEPAEGPPKGMDADKFLGKLYKVKGIKRYFDGVALHPYAAGIGRLQKIASNLRKVIVQNHDQKAALYITEIGWGSQNDPREVAFEVGWKGQARVLKNAYRYLVSSRKELNLKAVYWFTWKDVLPEVGVELCNFCDSTGLFTSDFQPKPAWSAFSRFGHGQLP